MKRFLYIFIIIFLVSQTISSQTIGIAPVCENKELIIEIQGHVADAIYEITGPNGFYIETTDLVISLGKSKLNMAGTYTLKANIGGIISTSTAVAVIKPSPTAAFKTDDDTYTLNVAAVTVYFTNYSTEALYYNWNFDDTLSSFNQSVLVDPMFTYTRAGNYTVTLEAKNENDCSDIATKIITVKEPSTFYIPNAFTPDGDGVNDLFTPVGLGFELEGYSMRIYDRKGRIIFMSTMPGDSWNGKNKSGNVCPMDTYICVIKFKTLDGEYKEYVSPVTLIR